MSNQQAVPNKTPLLSRAQQSNNPTNGKASQQELANCRYRAEMAQATLQQTRESLDKTRALMIEQNKEFIKLLTEQQSLRPVGRPHLYAAGRPPIFVKVGFILYIIWASYK
jgi:hypothetical protein